MWKFFIKVSENQEGCRRRDCLKALELKSTEENAAQHPGHSVVVSLSTQDTLWWCPSAPWTLCGGVHQHPGHSVVLSLSTQDKTPIGDVQMARKAVKVTWKIGCWGGGGSLFKGVEAGDTNTHPWQRSHTAAASALWCRQVNRASFSTSLQIKSVDQCSSS